MRGSILPNSITGYEITFRATGNFHSGYMQIVRWLGPLGLYQYVPYTGNSVSGVKQGDVLKASIVGNTITVWVNGEEIAQATDNMYATGNPGMGFFLEGATGVNSDYGFSSFMASDGIPLQVTVGPAATNITATAATITWTTNEAADSQVEYGPTSSYGSTTTLDPTPVTSHSINLTGLTASTLYHYRVKSKDAAGKPATSDDAMFSLTRRVRGQITSQD